MADLKKWFPFKFKRGGSKREAHRPGEPQETAENPMTPAREAALAHPWSSSPFAAMARMLDAMMNDPFLSHPLSLFGNVDRFFGDFSPTRFVPSIDVTDEGDALRVSAELPGMDKDDVEIEVHDGALVLRGEKKMERTCEEEGCYRTERYFGSFARRIPLPRDLDLSEAEASFDKGVLTVRLPKIERQGQEPQRIPLK